METKPALKSKTVWVALVMAVAAFFPGVQHWISENPQIFSEVVAGVFFVLRLVSKGQVDIA